MLAPHILIDKEIIGQMHWKKNTYNNCTADFWDFLSFVPVSTGLNSQQEVAVMYSVGANVLVPRKYINIHKLVPHDHIKIDKLHTKTIELTFENVFTCVCLSLTFCLSFSLSRFLSLPLFLSTSLSLSPSLSLVKGLGVQEEAFKGVSTTYIHKDKYITQFIYLYVFHLYVFM